MPSREEVFRVLHLMICSLRERPVEPSSLPFCGNENIQIKETKSFAQGPPWSPLVTEELKGSCFFQIWKPLSKNIRQVLMRTTGVKGVFAWKLQANQGTDKKFFGMGVFMCIVNPKTVCRKISGWSMKEGYWTAAESPSKKMTWHSDPFCWFV